MNIPFKYQKIIKHHLVKNILKMFLLGGLSYVLGMVQFNIPGLEGAISDFREIPLLISILYLKNPVYLIGVSFISAISAISIGAFWPTFTAHAIAIVVCAYLYQYIKKRKNYNIFQSAAAWLFYVLLFYYVLVIPLLVTTISISSFRKGLDFFTSYNLYAYSTRYEIVSTSLITILYFVQYITRKELVKHKNKLEYLVKERTEELETSNEELKSINDELYQKNKIIDNQNHELKTALQSLKETQAQLIHSEKMASLAILTAGVSHEINNPLNYVMGGYVGLKHYFNEQQIKSNEIDLFLNSIKTGVDKAAKIVNRLSQFSYNSGNLNEDCNIHTIIDNCLLMLENSLKPKIKIHKEFSKDVIIVKGNTSELHQVFINIFTNSFQAIDTKGSIFIQTQIDKNNAVIQIKDTGQGMKEEMISKISVPFFTTKNPGKGTGLGLAITSSIIDKHKGNMKFSSIFGKGTVVTISLPLKESS